MNFDSPPQQDRAATSVSAIRNSFVDHVEYTRGKSFDQSSAFDRYHALAITVRDRLARSWVESQRRYAKHDVKRAYYLSAEYLLGRALGNNLISLDL
ncbi:MAG: glycogen phosphorylase, partial [Myxococcaceae bacterium]|nr:glycogen phosphorylase [Myxococcaceae bacterium]